MYRIQDRQRGMFISQSWPTRAEADRFYYTHGYNLAELDDGRNRFVVTSLHSIVDLPSLREIVDKIAENNYIISKIGLIKAYRDAWKDALEAVDKARENKALLALYVDAKDNLEEAFGYSPLDSIFGPEALMKAYQAGVKAAM